MQFYLAWFGMYYNQWSLTDKIGVFWIRYYKQQPRTDSTRGQTNQKKQGKNMATLWYLREKIRPSIAPKATYADTYRYNNIFLKTFFIVLTLHQSYVN